MKRFLCVFIICCMLLVCFSTIINAEQSDFSVDLLANENTDTTDVSTLKVMSFNVYWNNIDTVAENAPTVSVVNSRENRKQQINSMLLGESIDIVGFQEIDNNWFQSFSWLDSRYAYIGGTHLGNGLGEGGYIVYNKNKLEVLESGVFWLAEGAPTTYTKIEAASSARICSWGIFKVKATGEVFIFMDTHMDYVGEVTAEQAAAICGQKPVLQALASSKYGAEENCSVIVVGDLNTYGDTEALRIFRNSFKDARVYSEGTTVPATHSTCRAFYYCESLDDVPQDSAVLDYIFVSDRVTVKNYEMFYTTTNLCEYGAYMSDHNAIVAEITFAHDPNTEWYYTGAASKTATLYNSAQLLGFAQLSTEANDYFNGWTIKLGNDIVYNTGDAKAWAAGTATPANVWNAIGTFKGTFDGQGYVISGLYFNDADVTGAGLFNTLSGATVKNVSVVNSYFKAYQNIGSIAVKATGNNCNVSNCYSDAILVSTPTGRWGGDNDNDRQASNVGGIVALGSSGATLVIDDCWFDGLADCTPTLMQDMATGHSVGGILGATAGGTVTISDCLMTGDVIAVTAVGGIVGHVDSTTVIERSIMLGDVACLWNNTNWSSWGLFVGYSYWRTITLKDVYSKEGVTMTHGSTTATAAHLTKYVGHPGITQGGAKPTYEVTIGVTKNGTYSSTCNNFYVDDNQVTKSTFDLLLTSSELNALEAFDYTNTWATVENSTPVLKALAYVAENKTSGQDVVAASDTAISMLDGAAVRLTDPTGLRFKAVVGADYLARFEGDGKTVTYGIIIAPTDYITGAFTVEALGEGKYVEVNAEKLQNESTKTEDGYLVFTAALAPVQEDNYGRNFSARSYIKVVEGDTTTYYYSEYDATENSRSIAYVAQEALNDTTVDYTDDQKELLNGFIPTT